MAHTALRSSPRTFFPTISLAVHPYALLRNGIVEAHFSTLALAMITGFNRRYSRQGHYTVRFRGEEVDASIEKLSPQIQSQYVV